MSKKAIIILAEGFEDVEAVTPIDILRRAGVEVFVAGLAGRTVRGARGTSINADGLLTDASPAAFDALVLPGGSKGAENLSKSPAVADWVKRFNKDKRLIAAICAAPAMVLAPLGVLDDKKATCFPGEASRLPPAVRHLAQPVVQDGPIITSQALGTALAFSLAIVEFLCGADAAAKVKQAVLA
jgi:protein deglycase